MAIAITLLGLTVIFAAGFLLAERLAPDHRWVERIVLGLLTGFALAAVLTYLAAILGVLLLGPGALLLVTAGMIVWRLRRPPRLPLTGDPDRGLDLLILPVLPLALAWFALPLLRRPMPKGWDPAFHTSIIESIRSVGRLPETWAPYEPLSKFNYPSGLHAVLASWGQATGLPSEQLFTLGFLILGALMLVVVYALGLRFGGAGRAGTLAVIFYGLTDGWGTLSGHEVWGGLPNLAGLALMAGFILAISLPARSTLLLAALFAAAAAFVHHLSFVLLGGTVLFVCGMEALTERRLSRVARTGLGALLIAGVLAGGLVLLMKTGRYDLTQGFRFDAESMVQLKQAFAYMGVLSLTAGLLGLVFALFTLREESQRLLPAWTVALLCFWVFFDVLYRGAVWFLFHENYTAFTPGRGLTDAAVPFALCAGVLLHHLLQRLPRTRLQLPTFGALALTLVLLLLGHEAELRRWRKAAEHRDTFENARALCAKVKQLTPAGAVLLAPEAGEATIWLPYLCEREFHYFPEPSYQMSDYRKKKASLRNPQAFAGFVRSVGQGPSVYLVTRAPSPYPLRGAAGGWKLLEVTP